MLTWIHTKYFNLLSMEDCKFNIHRRNFGGIHVKHDRKMRFGPFFMQGTLGVMIEFHLL